MLRMFVLPGSAVALGLVTAVAGAQAARELPLKLPPRPTVGAITQADLMTRLYQFADDSMGGRASGTEGHLKATAYIAREMERLGLEPAGPNGSYFQDLPMVSRGFAPGSAVWVGERQFRLRSDFGVVMARGATPRRVATAEVVVGGTQGDSSTWISAEEARGKVVVLRANPRQMTLNMRTLAQTPGSRFAAAAAVVVSGWDQLPSAIQGSMTRPSIAMRMAGPTAETAPTLVASAAMVDALVAATGQGLRLTLDYAETQAAARNVIAVLPGSDPALRGQYVALGAHSDHDPVAPTAGPHDSLRAVFAARRPVAPTLPPVGTRPARPDSIKNGADDDGSGSVALLELAEAFASAPQRPKRSLLFVWHAAEELGLLGAQYFVTEPTVPLDSIVAQLNMDMVGRGGADDIEGGGPQYLQLVGSRRLSKELGDLVEAVNRNRAHQFKFDYSYDADGHPERIYCRSDHAAYARVGIPVTFFHTGLHLDYHQVTDEPQYIDYQKLYNVSMLIHDVTRELANRPTRPKLDGPKPDPNAACRQ